MLRAANDEVLEALVQQVPKVDRVAVGVGRAVVEDELAGLGGVLVAQGVVELHGLPALDAGGLVLHQIGLHGKGGLGEVERGAIAALVARGIAALGLGRRGRIVVLVVRLGLGLAHDWLSSFGVAPIVGSTVCAAFLVPCWLALPFARCPVRFPKTTTGPERTGPVDVVRSPESVIE
jgi:hypothetical protein